MPDTITISEVFSGLFTTWRQVGGCWVCTCLYRYHLGGYHLPGLPGDGASGTTDFYYINTWNFVQSRLFWRCILEILGVLLGLRANLPARGPAFYLWVPAPCIFYDYLFIHFSPFHHSFWNCSDGMEFLFDFIPAILRSPFPFPGGIPPHHTTVCSFHHSYRWVPFVTTRSGLTTTTIFAIGSSIPIPLPVMRPFLSPPFYRYKYHHLPDTTYHSCILFLPFTYHQMHFY